MLTKTDPEQFYPVPTVINLEQKNPGLLRLSESEVYSPRPIIQLFKIPSREIFRISALRLIDSKNKLESSSRIGVLK